MATQKLSSSPNYFLKEKFALKMFGLSLTGDDSKAYKGYSFFFLVLVIFAYPLLSIKDVFKHEFDVVADMMIYEFAVFVGVSKTAVVLLNRKKFINILNKLEAVPFLANFERGGHIEELLIKECVRITHIQTVGYWVCAGGSIVAAVMYTLYKRISSNNPNNWEFPYGPFTILNVTYSPNYEISWLYQSISVASIACHFTTVDLITASILCHISYQFKILQNNLKRIVENAYGDMFKNKSPENPFEVDGSAIPWKYLKKSLEEFVQYHMAIITIASEMEEVFSSLLLLVFLGTLGMLCFIVYHTSLLPLNDVRLIRSIAEAMSAGLQVLTTCFWGEQVLFESQQVGMAALQANVVGTDIRFQKSLMFIIRRSRNPTKLTAGRFSDICLTSFTWILRTSYSAFMVLRNNKQ